jgi:hypothetical protein
MALVPWCGHGEPLCRRGPSSLYAKP